MKLILMDAPVCGWRLPLRVHVVTLCLLHNRQDSAERAPLLTAAVKPQILPGHLHDFPPLSPTFKGLKCHTVRKLARNSQEIAGSRSRVTDCRRNYSILLCFAGRVRNKNLLPKSTPMDMNCYTLLITQWSNVKVWPDCVQVNDMTRENHSSSRLLFQESNTFYITILF